MTTPAELDARLAQVLKALAKDPLYAEVLEAYAAAQAGPRKGFGTDALKSHGKIFCMVSSRAEFVVKLDKKRVAALVAGKQGRYFDAGKGKPLQAWFVATDAKLPLAALAKEAFAFVAGRH